MKVLGLDNKEYKWSFSSANTQKSNLHSAARQLLKELFPFDKIYEDITIPGSKTGIRKTLLYADFFLPNRNLMVEVNGEQHSKHIPFFHETTYDFLKARSRDRDKINWCELNNITLVILEFNEQEKWKNQLMER
jgi:very-short-patch-repair endonuclease